MEQSFLTPEDFEKIMGAATYPEDLQQLQMQRALAEQLRQGNPGVETRTVGRVAVAPHPMSAIAGMLNAQRSNRMMRDTLKQQQELIKALKDARIGYGRQVMGTSGPAMSPPGDQGNGVTTYGVP